MRPSKRDELVQKVLIVLYQNGFHATGMDMLVRETGISKTSMYKHFGSKEDLILAALRLRDEEFTSWLFRRMKELGTTPRSQLLAMFDALREWFAKDDFRGCMFMKASSEFQDEKSPIYEFCEAHNQKILSYIRDLTQQAGASDPDTLARHLLLLKEGAIVMAHMVRGENPAMDAKAAAKILLASALGS